MRKYLLALLFSLALCSTARGQTTPVTTLTASGTTCVSPTAGSALIMQIGPSVGGASFTINANAGGNTITFYASGDGAKTYSTLSVTPSNSTTTVTSTSTTTAGSLWQANVAGYTHVCMLMTTQSSGNTVVNIYPSTASARANGGGGGGSGSVTSIATTGPIGGGTITTTGTITCTTCTTNASALTSNVIPKGGGGQALVLSSATDNGTTFAVTEPITSTGSLTAGSGCTPAGTSATGGVCMTEAASTGWTPTAGFDYTRADSTTHWFICSGNGGSEVSCSPSIPSSWTSGHVASLGTWPLLADGGAVAANLVVASSPGAGIAHFAGSTQTVTSSAVSLTADISGVLPIANGGTNTNTAAAGTMPQASSTTASTWTLTPSLGVASTSTGTIELFNSGVAFGNIFASNSAATATNTIQGFAAVPTTNTVPKCVSASTTCTLTQSAIVDNGTTVSTGSEPIVTTGAVSTGTSPPTCTVGTAGVHCMTEGTAPTGAASVDMVYANATNHCLDALNNNVDDGCLLSVTNGATYPKTIVSGVSGGIPYFSSTTAESASGLLTQYGVVFGGGAGNAPTVSAQGAANMPLIGQGAANPIFSTIAYPTTVTSGGVCYGSSTTAISCGAILNTNILVKGGGSGATPTNTSITDDAKNITTSEVVAAGNKVFVTADFTDSTSGSLVLITGLTWTLPTSKAANYSFHCELMFDQGTAAVVDEFGVGVTGTAPTNLSADGRVFASASGAWTASGVLTGLASTTPTLVVSFTPSAITTVWTASLDGTIEQPSNATPGVFSIYAYTTTGSDNLIVKRGSYCSLF